MIKKINIQTALFTFAAIILVAIIIWWVGFTTSLFWQSHYKDSIGKPIYYPVGWEVQDANNLSDLAEFEGLVFQKTELNKDTIQRVILIEKLRPCAVECELQQLLTTQLAIRNQLLGERAFIYEDSISVPYDLEHHTCQGIAQDQVIGFYEDVLGTLLPVLWETNIIVSCNGTHYWILGSTHNPQTDIILPSVINRMLSKSLP